MGQWTWLFTKFPEADMELMSDPIEAEDANVLVRTFRVLPPSDGVTASYEVRVAPHNVAPFRGGPWIHRFSETELARPGDELVAFRAALARKIESAKTTETR